MRARTGAIVMAGAAAALLWLALPAGMAGATGGATGDAPAAGPRMRPDGSLAGGAAPVGDTGIPGSSVRADDGDTPGAPGAGASDAREGRERRDAAAPGTNAAPDAAPREGEPRVPPELRPPRVDTLARAVPLGEIFFGPNTTELTADARRRLDEAARGYRAAGSDARPLLLTGHADQRGDPKVNARISRARAEAVAEYLVARGVPPERIEVRYAGASRPMASGSSPEANASNRRVVIEMLPARER